MNLEKHEIWGGLARAISSADGQFTEPEYAAAFRAGDKLLGLPCTQEISPWENTTASHKDIAVSFRDLCDNDPETAKQMLVGLVYIAQADDEVSVDEAKLMHRLFHMADISQDEVESICESAKNLRIRKA